jgi:hypothetical protein
MSMELVSILTVMGRAGFGMSLPTIIFFVVLGLAFTILLWSYFSFVQRSVWANLPSPNSILRKALKYAQIPGRREHEAELDQEA